MYGLIPNDMIVYHDNTSSDRSKLLQLATHLNNKKKTHFLSQINTKDMSSVKLTNHTSVSSCTSNPCNPFKPQYFCKNAVYIRRSLCRSCYPRERWRAKHITSEYTLRGPVFCKMRRLGRFPMLASADDGVTVNGIPQADSSNDMEEMRAKLNQSLQGKDYSDGLIQSLHDAARVFELAIKEQASSSKPSWFSTAWLGVDKNAWVKALSYQASIYSLLQAANEISSRGDERDRDINVFVHRSLSRQSAPLESLIRDELVDKQPEAYEWFWSKQLPIVVTTFVNYFERDPRFKAATTVDGRGLSLSSGSASDISLLMLALTCIAAITKLGAAKVSCSQFFSMIPDVTGRLMDMLVDFTPIHQAYYPIKDIGLRREFLAHFGPRAAYSFKNDRGTEEVTFWVELVQKQLQRAIHRERIWSRLTTCESIEVLEKDLAMFGFFIALGRSTKSYLSVNGFHVIDDHVENLIRHFIGGSVLYYPQLSSISSYQLYVEVVCEELEWLPFYPSNTATKDQSRDHKSKEGPPNPESIPHVLDVCSYWLQSFIKYSQWLENPSNTKAARFLSRGHSMLKDCMEDMGVLKNRISNNGGLYQNTSEAASFSSAKRDLYSFDKALESVEEALNRLEELLQELHVSSSKSGKEDLQAACSDLEKIRKLKKEAEFLEASFRAKATSLQQGDYENNSSSSINEENSYSKGRDEKSANMMADGSTINKGPANRAAANSRGLWSFFVRQSTEKEVPGLSASDKTGTSADKTKGDSEPNEIRRFELLRHELIELEERVQKSTKQSENEEDFLMTNKNVDYAVRSVGNQLATVQKNENVFEKSFDKLKEASTDVFQGTQLLAIDVAAALGLLRRSLTGDELTEKEKKAFRRTVTDVASVVPIGILMLLPVTAVGHAAMLAAIQRYVPALIPSTYGPERLYLLRQLEKLKKMESSEASPEEITVEGNSLNRSTDV